MLTPKQIRFCEEFLVDLNGTQAAIRAGYSKKTANEQASQLLAKVSIQEYLGKLRDELSQRTAITVDFVVQSLKQVALRCMQEVPVMKFDYEAKALMQKRDADGKGVWEFDSSGANRALELLGKHVGAFERDNTQKKPESQPFSDSQVEKIITELRKK